MIREPGDEAQAEGGGPFVHDAAEPARRVLIPDRGGFVRGLGLLALAASALAAAVLSLQKLGWLATPLAGVLGVSAVLSLWAGAIHVTGGEKFDDHPWV
jgi:hypothetical protein